MPVTPPIPIANLLGTTDANNNLNVNLAAGTISGGNAAASATGSAVPASADYTGLNVGGTLRGATGVNPTGTVYAQQMDIESIGGVVIATLPASAETGTVFNGTSALTPKFAKIAVSSSGDNTLVSAVNPKKIRVLAYNFISNGTVNAKFQSGASGTDLTGLKYCVANMGLVAPFCPTGWFETASNTLLNLNLSAGVAVGGELVYVEV